MTKELSTQHKPMTINSLVNSDTVKNKFREILGKKSAGFVASILQIVSNNALLQNAEPMSIIAAASIAATLDLPINQNLGFAYIIPYNNRKTGKQEAQFQMGYKGFIQLAQRSGLFKTISATAVYEGQIVESNPLTGYKFDFSRNTGKKIIGFASFFQLLNGFEKTLYMTVEELEAHGVKYSQTARKGFGLWVDNFEAMALKTVLKLLLSKFAPLSVEMQTAVISDQSVVKNAETLEVEYVDNSKNPAIDLKGADLTTGLKIKGEKAKEPEVAENPEIEPEVEKTAPEIDDSAEILQPAEPLEGDFQCAKCKDISALTKDGKQECQICGEIDWKPVGEAGKRMARAMKKR